MEMNCVEFGGILLDSWGFLGLSDEYPPRPIDRNKQSI